MRWWILIVALLAPLSHAQSLSFVFERVPLRELARVVYGEALGKSYLIEPELLEDEALFSVSLRNVDTARIADLVSSMLKDRGLRVQLLDGEFYRIGRDRPADRWDVFIYEPKYRSVGYLADLVTPLFAAGSFGFQRGISGSTAGNPGSPVQPQGMSTPSRSSNPPVDGGGSAGSLQNRHPDYLVFRGEPHEIERLKGFLARLDTPAGELRVRAVVYEVTNDDAASSAVSLAVSLLGGNLTLRAGTALQTPYQVVGRLAGFDAAYAALSSDSRFRSVSAPSVRVRSGSPARFSVGSDTPVLGAVAFQPTGGTVQSVQYQSSGIILELTPTVRQSAIDLTLQQTVSNFAPTTTGVNNTPTLLKRELRTEISLQPGELVVLGGLTDTRTADSSSGFPFLPRFLRNSSSSDSKSELVLVLTAERI